jgi:hypothetical protein
MTKAFELIGTPEKWSNDALEIGPGSKHCAYTAILAAYGTGHAGEVVSEKLRDILGSPSIVTWNDKSDYETVYLTLKENDI